MIIQKIEGKTATEYWVLVLHLKQTRLLHGESESLTEVVDDIFPMQFIDEYQHQRSSYRGQCEKDRSTVNHHRQEAFYRKVDQALASYLSAAAVPLVVIGTDRGLGQFKQVTQHGDQVNYLHGKAEESDLPRLAELVWAELQDHEDQERWQEYWRSH